MWQLQSYRCHEHEPRNVDHHRNICRVDVIEEQLAERWIDVMKSKLVRGLLDIAMEHGLDREARMALQAPISTPLEHTMITSWLVRMDAISSLG